MRHVVKYHFICTLIVICRFTLRIDCGNFWLDFSKQCETNDEKKNSNWNQWKIQADKLNWNDRGNEWKEKPNIASIES